MKILFTMTLIVLVAFATSANCQTRSPDAPPKKEVCETAKALVIATDINVKMFKASGRMMGQVDLWTMIATYLENEGGHLSNAEALRNVAYFNSAESGQDLELINKCTDSEIQETQKENKKLCRAGQRVACP